MRRRGASAAARVRMNAVARAIATSTLLCLAAAAAAISAAGDGNSTCPDGVARGAKHFSLLVADATYTLPGGGSVPSRTYNGSVVGPPIVVDLGDDVTVDVTNTMTEGKATPRHACAPHACPHRARPPRRCSRCRVWREVLI